MDQVMQALDSEEKKEEMGPGAERAARGPLSYV
jgi:hypothetical protein